MCSSDLTLTEVAKYPALKLKDPYAKKGLAPWKKWCISIALLAVVAGGLYLANLLAWANLPSPLPCFNDEEAVVEQVVEEAPVEEVAETAVVE